MLSTCAKLTRRCVCCHHDRVFATITKRVPFLAKTVWNPIASQVQETVIKPRTNANSDLLENALKGKQYLIGDQLTAADGECYFSLSSSHT